MTATLQRVSPNPKRALSPEDETRIRFAMHVRDAAYEHLRRAVLDAADNGASVRVLAEFTGMSTNTISRWKADARDSEATEHRWWNAEEQRWEYPE